MKFSKHCRRLRILCLWLLLRLLRKASGRVFSRPRRQHLVPSPTHFPRPHSFQLLPNRTKQSLLSSSWSSRFHHSLAPFSRTSPSCTDSAMLVLSTLMSVTTVAAAVRRV